MGLAEWAARLSGNAEQTGLLIAAAGAPGTFEPSLAPRSLLDQALVTGIGCTLSQALTAITQDLIEAAGSTFADRMPGATPGARQQAATLIADVAVIPAGLLLQRVLSPQPGGDPLIRGLSRRIVWRTTVTGIGGASFAVVRGGVRRLDATVGADGRLAAVPVAVPAGLLLGFVLESHRRRRALADEPSVDTLGDTSPIALTLRERARAVAASLAVMTGLSVGAFAERAVADAVGTLLAKTLPGGRLGWRAVGHVLTLGALELAGTAVFHRAIVGIEAGTTMVEPILDDKGGQRWLGSAVSGSTASHVPWASLGREGRRHVLLYPRPQPVADRPTGLPDLSIGTVMGEPAVAEPVLIYVGLDSAPTARERVDLALAEMDRTGAWERSLLMLISPTGSGYVNYCATAAAAYLTRGDAAMVTLQYSKRPSPLSLFKIDDARDQNRLLWLEISARLRERGGRRPRVVLFGESLGAHTSQDVLLNWGTLGPQALGIDRALWVGTPYGSGWMRQVTGPPRPDVDPALVAVVNDFGQIEAMPPERRSQLRYVLLSHDNDGVTKFGVDLITTRPEWLGPDRPRAEGVAGGSPRGISPRMRWRPMTTFLQSLIDMKNAQITRGYRAFAHDYRPDLTRFVSEVFGLPASDQQIRDIEAALETREQIRDRLLSPDALGTGGPNPTPRTFTDGPAVA